MELNYGIERLAESLCKDGLAPFNMYGQLQIENWFEVGYK